MREEEVSRVIGLLRSGRSVCVRGQWGSGVSAVLRRAERELERRGTEVFSVRASAALAGVSFGALRFSMSGLLRDAPDAATIVDRLTQTLGMEETKTVIVDGVDQLDTLSSYAIGEVVRRLKVPVLITLSRRAAHIPSPIALPSLALVELEPFSHARMEVHLRHRAEGAVDPRVVSRIYIDTAGNRISRMPSGTAHASRGRSSSETACGRCPPRISGRRISFPSSINGRASSALPRRSACVMSLWPDRCPFRQRSRASGRRRSTSSTNRASSRSTRARRRKRRCRSACRWSPAISWRRRAPSCRVRTIWPGSRSDVRPARWSPRESKTRPVTPPTTRRGRSRFGRCRAVRASAPGLVAAGRRVTSLRSSPHSRRASARSRRPKRTPTGRVSSPIRRIGRATRSPCFARRRSTRGLIARFSTRTGLPSRRVPSAFPRTSSRGRRGARCCRRVGRGRPGVACLGHALRGHAAAGALAARDRNGRGPRGPASGGAHRGSGAAHGPVMRARRCRAAWRSSNRGASVWTRMPSTAGAYLLG